MSDFIFFEHPLNERIRTFLRLEHLFLQIDHFRPAADSWSTRAAISAIIDILVIISRADIKNEILKELERQISNLERMRQEPEVNIQTLSRIVDDLEQALHQVYGLNGQVGQRLRKNEFLTSIMQRSSIPGGNCHFDLPHYHQWLNQPYEIRLNQLQNWLQELNPIREAICLLMSLVRSSAHPVQEVAEKGFFQKSLEPNSPTQLVRVGLPRSASLFAEVSGNKHRVSIRFLDATDLQRPVQTADDVGFEFASCVF